MRFEFKDEGNLWGVPYGDCIAYGEDYNFKLFHYEVAMGDLFIQDMYHEVMGEDQALALAEAIQVISTRHKQGEFEE